MGSSLRNLVIDCDAHHRLVRRMMKTPEAVALYVNLCVAYLENGKRRIVIEDRLRGWFGFVDDEQFNAALDALIVSGYVSHTKQGVAPRVPIWDQRRQKTPAQEAKAAMGFVYLIRAERMPHEYKIGKSNNPEKRSRTIGTKMPVETTLLHSFPCDNASASETMLHTLFGDKRLNGEWFGLSGEDVDFIMSISRIESAPGGLLPHHKPTRDQA